MFAVSVSLRFRDGPAARRDRLGAGPLNDFGGCRVPRVKEDEGSSLDVKRSELFRLLCLSHTNLRILPLIPIFRPTRPPAYDTHADASCEGRRDASVIEVKLRITNERL